MSLVMWWVFMVLLMCVILGGCTPPMMFVCKPLAHEEQSFLLCKTVEPKE